MAHFAHINENNVVTQVIVIGDENENNAQDFINNTLGLPGTWIKTSYNTYRGEHLLGGTPLRKNYAGIDYTYNAERDAFIPPQPYPSWVFNKDACHWDAPVAYPEGEGYYDWDEDSLTWILVEE